jgi:hypothetical protein
MTQTEALRLALEALDSVLANHKGAPVLPWIEARDAIKAALEAKDEPVKVAHRHEWFRTGEMKVGQMRCISCGTWAEEEMPQRTWVGLTEEEIKAFDTWHDNREEEIGWVNPSEIVAYIEAKLKEKNT